MGDDILHQLRAGTTEQHARLEAAVDIQARLTSVERYAELLEYFLGWYEPMEERLTRVAGWDKYDMDLEARRKARWLRSDLVALGYSAAEVAALPRCEVLPAVDTLAQGFGCAYVIEGSTLGGRQIAGLLKESSIPESARRFFESYGAEVGARWKEFLEALTAFAAQGQSDEEIVSAARSAFGSMQEWVSHLGAVRG